MVRFADESDPDMTAPKQHARRASTAAWPSGERVSPPMQTPALPTQEDRAAGLLRRLSLGGTALRVRPPAPYLPSTVLIVEQPQVPAIKTTLPTAPVERVPPNTPAVERAPVPRKTRRANTLAPGTPRPKRAPSPMGERILTGHFDGFN